MRMGEWNLHGELWFPTSRISVPVTSIVGFNDEALEGMEGIEEEELEGEEPDEDDYE
ncbi:hypothetical protein PAXINDRAFT_17442 [Paxillus involutus ATCC 200175]|uniref:Uncharacterized protein n=1 Tax=Paxillus involutus ATCC 200175 TaxID=664439 RepID=A0A0C9TQK2_PAXIN|nr:hypothetical protein PAXINDRAFT_17442 [Paxillus involutus ATCC 200175]